jgi:hypothetical protein
VHKVAMNAKRPEQYFLQNHGGVYRSDDSGRTWQSIAEGLPADFGFAMVAHPHRPEVIYNFPLVADALRFPPEGRCRVYRSEDAGGSWTGLGKGLPDEGFYSAVMRDAMCADDAEPTGIYFGSRSGQPRRGGQLAAGRRAPAGCVLPARCGDLGGDRSVCRPCFGRSSVVCLHWRRPVRPSARRWMTSVSDTPRWSAGCATSAARCGGT